VDLPRGLLTALRKGAHKELTIPVIVEDILGVVTTAHHMINRPWILNAQLPRHGTIY
jgi:hypothetical protein